VQAEPTKSIKKDESKSQVQDEIWFHDILALDINLGLNLYIAINIRLAG
jgi:hypothetical protein